MSAKRVTITLDNIDGLDLFVKPPRAYACGFPHS